MLGMTFRIWFEKSLSNFDKPKHSTWIYLCLKVKVEEGKSNGKKKHFRNICEGILINRRLALTCEPVISMAHSLSR